MKYIFITLLVLFLVLQYELWFSEGGIRSAMQIKQSIMRQQQLNQQLQTRNRSLIADIIQLKSGQQAIEERARNDLGMIKKGETFYRIVP